MRRVQSTDLMVAQEAPPGLIYLSVGGAVNAPNFLDTN
ncbi:hypothetical protein C7374_10595 [Falsochrobactrum ovis]|uniref:Uncharacterized protein n=1 Tax=Falsochrobactrum ovis TaxID=1293442 RepID=A0A364JVA0_9HYPH|nr:hypothetical protein C7374_10595 [Falsochrobactrum ovis]